MGDDEDLNDFDDPVIQGDDALSSGSTTKQIFSNPPQQEMSSISISFDRGDNSRLTTQSQATSNPPENPNSDLEISSTADFSSTTSQFSEIVQ